MIKCKMLFVSAITVNSVKIKLAVNINRYRPNVLKNLELIKSFNEYKKARNGFFVLKNIAGI